MEWMKLGEINPPADMEILLWHKKEGCLIGFVTYGGDGQLYLVELKSDRIPCQYSEEWTHWCEIPKFDSEEK